MHKGCANEAEDGKTDYFFRRRGVYKEEEILRHGKAESGGYHIHHPVHGLVKIPAAAYEHENDEEFNEFLYKGIYADRSGGIFRHSQEGRCKRKEFFQTGGRESRNDAQNECFRNSGFRFRFFPVFKQEEDKPSGAQKKAQENGYRQNVVYYRQFSTIRNSFWRTFSGSSR